MQASVESDDDDDDDNNHGDDDDDDGDYDDDDVIIAPPVVVIMVQTNQNGIEKGLRTILVRLGSISYDFVFFLEPSTARTQRRVASTVQLWLPESITRCGKGTWSGIQ